MTESDEPTTLPTDIPFSPSTIKELSKSHNLCFTGPALAALEAYCVATEQSYITILKSVCPEIKLFARVSPTQKESILIGNKLFLLRIISAL